MEDKPFKPVNLNSETHARLQARATMMHQSMAAHVMWLLDQEDAHRFSIPQPVITIEQAQSAAEATK